jgi:2-phosphosulfolactate phosphatase
MSAVRVRVAWLPAALTAPAAVYVVLDVLRASSTLVTLLARGAAPVYVAATVQEARALATSCRPRPLLCGEVGGIPPPDFDAGNSPSHFAAQPLAGQAAVLATSNGTRALARLAAAPCVLVGCLLNATAAARHAWSRARALGGDLALVCAGDDAGTTFALEDALAAGYLVDRLLEVEGVGRERLDDAALAAWRLWCAYTADDPATAAPRALAEATHGRELAALGFAADLAYCARLDALPLVPVLAREGARLVLRASPGAVG